MTPPEQLIGFHELGERSHSCWVPSSSDGAHLDLEQGDCLHWAGEAVISSNAQGWKLPNSRLVATDRRTAFLTRDFDKGGGWIGFGTAGVLIAGAANAVSILRAKKRSAGLVLVGQMRHEWVHAVGVRHNVAKLTRALDTYVDLHGATTTGPADISLWGPFADDHLGAWLAMLISWHRMPWMPEHRTELDQLRENLTSFAAWGQGSDALSRVPGDAERLIQRVGPQ